MSQQTGLCLPTPAALLAHHRTVSTSSGRIQGTTPSASNTAGVLPVTKHSIPDMLYITYIPETAHTVCKPLQPREIYSHWPWVYFTVLGLK